MYKNNIIKILTPIFLWCIYILFPLFVLPKPPPFINDNLQILIYLMVSLSSIGFYYFNFNFLIPNFLFKNKYLHFILFIVLFIVLSILLTRIIITLSFPEEIGFRLDIPRLLGSYLFRFFILFFIGFGFQFSQKIKQIETDKITSELNTLKAQIEPHFLFNTLNGIYAQALTKSDNTAESISKLSNIMRYVLTETSAEKVSLKNEINYLTNYISLQKIRLSDKTNVDFQVIGNPESKQIPPLLFINFIENAFKYGVSNELKSLIKIHLIIENEILSLYVENKSFQTGNQNSIEIGLKNTRRRLDLLFNKDYNLNITIKDNTYNVALKIKLK